MRTKVTLSELTDMEVTPWSKWLNVATGRIMMVDQRLIDPQTNECAELRVVSLEQETASEVRAIDFARWIDEKKITRIKQLKFEIPNEETKAST